MTRAGGISRFLPGLLLGLLVAAWMVGLFWHLGYFGESTADEKRDPLAYGFVLTFVPMVTLLLPFLVGVGNSFRYSLWHYLAFTAIIALELTFFMWWLK